MRPFCKVLHNFAYYIFVQLYVQCKIWVLKWEPLIKTHLKNLSSFGILAVRERNITSCVNTVLQQGHIDLNQSVFPLCQLQVSC